MFTVNNRVKSNANKPHDTTGERCCICCENIFNFLHFPIFGSRKYNLTMKNKSLESEYCEVLKSCLHNQ